MTIGPRVLNGWKLLKEHGDLEKISIASVSEENKTPIHPITIARAMKSGRMNERTYEVIQKFYKQRAEDIRKVENKAVQELNQE